MARTRLRDIEICVEEDTLKVIPYKLTLPRGSAYFESDCSEEGQGRILSVAMNRTANHGLVNYILNLPDFTVRGNWDDFSEWDTTERFFKHKDAENMPQRLANWLNGLKEYEVKMS